MRLKLVRVCARECVFVCARVAKLKVITTTPHLFNTNLSTEPDPNVSAEHQIK